MTGTDINLPVRLSRKELNALYRDIPLKDTTFRTLRKYFSAAANLYGIIKLRKLYEIISTQCPNLVTKDEFLKFSEIAIHERENYYILCEKDLYIESKKTSLMEYEVIDIMLFFQHPSYYELLELQEGKPFYVPEKKVFLQYSDTSYYEETEQSEKLKSFLQNKFGMMPLDAENAIIDIAVMVKSGMDDINEVFDLLDGNYGAEADLNAKALNEFMTLFTDFSNNSRMQCNRGHTPMELRELMPPSKKPPQMSLGSNIRQRIASGEISADDMRKEVLAMRDIPELTRFSLLKEIADAEKLAPKPKKVGRNDPCPCGSGKKYKHCCGR